MRIKSVYSQDFKKYGKVLTGYKVDELLEKLIQTTAKPDATVIYEPSDAELEALSVSKIFCTNAYGGMPIQIGYCNGNNTKLNCLEYHRGCEVDIPADDIVLLLAPIQSLIDGKMDTKFVEAFSASKGTVVRIYETTLHYTPCNGVTSGAVSKNGFRVIIILPKDTNTARPELKPGAEIEDKLLWAKNKWLVACSDSSEAMEGAFVGLLGGNIDIRKTT
jgi:hypothetical protein